MDLEEKTKNNINSIIMNMNDNSKNNMQTQVNIEINMLNDTEYDNFLFSEYGIESWHM